MKRPLLDSLTLSEFFESIALMLASGMQTSQALWTLAQDASDKELAAVCQDMYQQLDEGRAGPRCRRGRGVSSLRGADAQDWR